MASDVAKGGGKPRGKRSRGPRASSRKAAQEPAGAPAKNTPKPRDAGNDGAIRTDRVTGRKDPAAMLTQNIRRAEGGDRVAQYKLGMRYLSGNGVGRNEAESRGWLIKAVCAPSSAFDVTRVAVY
jgi:TPR repeat protein